MSEPGGDGRADAAAGNAVSLVGAGPGDPRLLTRRAARLLARADVVVLDRRSLADIAALAPATAEHVFVGRTAEGPGWSTERIVDLLVSQAATGRNVVRLKSGDPFVCSRGGEERLALLERGIPCEVVPGVTAATAAPLAAGVRRGRSVTILAGNDDPLYPALDLGILADPSSSLVVLTGRARQGDLAAALLAAGLDADTPAVVVHGATRATQQVAACTLATLGTTHLPAPATVVIGPMGTAVHIPDGWVDLPTSAGAAVVSGAAVAVASRRTAARLKERATTLPAVLAAYLLVAQLPVIPLGVGTTAHLVGTGLATALVGPWVAIVCVTTVVMVQALVLADGGVTAIGLNLLVNGVAPALAATAFLVVGRRWAGTGPARLPLVAGAAAAVAALTAAVTAATVLALGGTDVIPPGTVAAVLGAAHLVVAAGEGLLTAGIVRVLLRLRPDLVAGPATRIRPATAKAPTP